MSTATVTDIGAALEERINAIVESGLLTYDDDDVTKECARRYVDEAHRKYERAANRDVERTAKIRQEANLRLRERVSSIVAEMQADLEVKWSAALLASSFVLNGIRVTWQDATVEQHEARALMLEGMASGDLQTAAIHRQAMHDITARGVDSLAGLMS